MYNDILMTGSRSFAVCLVDEDGRFAETASIFYLEELKEVSEQTKDQVKYVCQHKCTKRVRLTKVLNPTAWKDGSTYLKVQVQDIVDDGTPPEVAMAATVQPEAPPVAVDEAALAAATAAAGAYAADMAALCLEMSTVVDLMDSFKEEPRFSPQLKGVFKAEEMAAVGAEGDAQVWAMAALWQTFAGERVQDVQRRGTSVIEGKLMTYLTKNGTVSVDSLRGKQLSIPPQLEREVQRMTEQIREEVADKLDATFVPYQQMLQTPCRGERVRLLRRVVGEDKKRLDAKASLRSLFSGGSSGDRGSSGGGTSGGRASLDGGEEDGEGASPAP